MTEYSNTDNLFQGVVQGCLSGQQDRVDALNERIYDRVFPDIDLRPNYDPRPVSTKYCRFPTADANHDRRASNLVNAPIYLEHSTDSFFYSASNNAQFLRNIDLETNLRNQNTALQHGAPQGVYVPSSTSDLYRVVIPSSSNNGDQPFPELFNQTRTQSISTPSILKYPSIGNSNFFNHTRTQLRNTAEM
jgi:hypothetical protein